MEKTTKNPKSTKMYTDHRGNEIPSNFIHKIDRDKHAATIRLFNKAKKLSEALAKFKAELLKESDALHEQALAENRIKVRANAKGGYSICTIDKKKTIRLSISESMSFDDNINMAQELIGQYIGEVTQGVDNGVKVLIDEAFKTRSGQLDTKRVLGLLKLDIKHEKWVKAMELIKRSISVDSSKRYVSIIEKDAEGKECFVKLDFSSL